MLCKHRASAADSICRTRPNNNRGRPTSRLESNLWVFSSFSLQILTLSPYIYVHVFNPFRHFGFHRHHTRLLDFKICFVVGIFLPIKYTTFFSFYTCAFSDLPSAFTTFSPLYPLAWVLMDYFSFDSCEQNNAISVSYLYDPLYIASIIFPWSLHICI